MKTKLVKEDRGLLPPGLQSLMGARASSSSSSSGEPPPWPRCARPGPLGPINTSHSFEGGRARRVGPATAARERAGGVRATCAASCVAPGGRNARRHGRTGGTGTAGGPCACGSGASARPSARTSSRSRPSCSGRASRLQGGSESRPQFPPLGLACPPVALVRRRSLR